MRKLFIMIVMVVLLFLVGCTDYEEKLNINQETKADEEIDEKVLSDEAIYETVISVFNGNQEVMMEMTEGMGFSTSGPKSELGFKVYDYILDPPYGDMSPEDEREAEDYVAKARNALKDYVANEYIEEHVNSEFFGYIDGFGSLLNPFLVQMKFDVLEKSPDQFKVQYIDRAGKAAGLIIEAKVIEVDFILEDQNWKISGIDVTHQDADMDLDISFENVERYFNSVNPDGNSDIIFLEETDIENQKWIIFKMDDEILGMSSVTGLIASAEELFELYHYTYD